MTESKQINIRLGPEELKMLEDFQFENRIPTRTEALRRILRMHAQRKDTPFGRLPSTNDKAEGRA